MNATRKPHLGSRRQPEESRAAILEAATQEFAQEGVAGARTDAIAKAARVNKALLYYYFEDKESLYGAVLDHVFTGLKTAVEKALALNLPPRERLLAYVAAHYDYVASNPRFPRVVQGNMIWAGRGAMPQFERIVKQYLKPIFTGVFDLLEEGIAAGEFRPVDTMHFMSTMVTSIVSYFVHAPSMRLVTGFDPLSKEHVAAHRAAILDFISAALFTQRVSPKGARR